MIKEDNSDIFLKICGGQIFENSPEFLRVSYGNKSAIIYGNFKYIQSKSAALALYKLARI